VTNDIDTLATALYVRTDDLPKQDPGLAPWRPRIGLQPRLTDAGLVTLAVMQALLGYTSESRWLRYARAHLGHLFGYLPGRPGYNRLRAAAGLISTLIRLLAADTSPWADDVWVVDSTAVGCGRSRDTARRSTWPDGPGTGTAPAIPATSGGCGCTWSPPWAACRPASRSPAPKPTSAMACEALAVLDCTDDIGSWARRFARAGGASVDPVVPAGFEWRQALGDCHRLPEWIGYSADPRRSDDLSTVRPSYWICRSF
jgi:hypothetical protein